MPLGSYTSAAFTTATGVAVAANADVEVRRESDSGLASIFSDRAGASAITQPGFQADSEGRFTFYAAGISGGYQVKVTKGAETFTARFQATGTARELDADPFWVGVWSAANAAAARLALGFAAIAAKGDSWWGSAVDTIVKLAVGANGTILMVRSAAAPGVAYVAALNKAIYAFTYANNAVDVVNDIDIAAGGAMDSTGAYWITGAALTKQSDVAWAVGNNAGGLDTGAVGNNDYYIHAIARSDTGVVDYLFSLSPTAPTMPTGYDFRRLIGWFKRVAGTIVAFDTYEIEGGGLRLTWDSPTLDINLANTLTTARRTDAVKVPLTFSVLAELNIYITDATTGQQIIVYCPDQSDLVPSSSVAPLANIETSPSFSGAWQRFVRTSSAGLIAARSTLATADNYRVATMGFDWDRRNAL